MARSIHETLSDLARAHREGIDEFLRVGQRIGTKIDVKRRVRRGRRETLPHDASPVSSEGVAIEVLDRSPWTHFPADPPRIARYLDVFPTGTLDGLERITLALGADHQPEGDDHAEDPWTGRRSARLPADVYAGISRGFYVAGGGRIQLHAFVYDRLPLDEGEFLGAFLLLDFLHTLTHELAHHQDYMLRRGGGRGRWAMTPGAKAETYAERQTEAWTRELLVGFLLEDAPACARALWGSSTAAEGSTKDG